MEDTGRRESKVRKVVGVRARRAQRTREEILRAGLKVFSEKGFQGATMDDIALELEATKGLLYYHFKTKEEILSAILRQSPVIAALESGLSSQDLPFREAVSVAVNGALAILDANRDFIRFLHVQAMLSGKEAEVVYTDAIERLTDSVVVNVERYKAAGQVRADADCRNWATMTVSLVITYFLENQIFGPNHRPAPGYLDYVIGNLVSLIEAPPPSNPSSNL